MKKLSLLLVCVLVMASIATIGASALLETYTAVYTETMPTIDGKVDAAWDAAEWGTIAQTHDDNFGTNDAPMFKIMHDDTYIYYLVEYTDTNGSIIQKGKWDGESHNVGSESACIAFCDPDGKQQEFMFTSPEPVDGAISMNAYINSKGAWVENISSVPEAAEGFRYVALRTGTENICFEVRILKSKIGTVTDYVDIELALIDSAPAESWNHENFSWASPALKNIKSVNDANNYGILTLAAKGAAPTEDTTVPTEDTTVPTEDTTVPTEDTTVPTEETTLPTEETTLPTEETTVPTEDSVTVESDDTTAAEDDTTAEDPTSTPDDTDGASNIVLPVVIVAAVVVVAVVIVLVLKAKKKSK